MYTLPNGTMIRLSMVVTIGKQMTNVYGDQVRTIYMAHDGGRFTVPVHVAEDIAGFIGLVNITEHIVDPA